MFKDFPLPMLVTMLIACGGVILVSFGFFLMGLIVLGVATFTLLIMARIYFL